VSPVYRRAPDVAETPLGEELFLVSGATQQIFHLEPTAAALWRLLAEPASLAAVRRAFAEAFPEAEPDRIAADVEAALATLVANGLAQRLSP